MQQNVYHSTELKRIIIMSKKEEKYWDKQTFKVGRKLRFKNAKELWEAAKLYFAWCIDNPIYDDKLTISKKDEVTDRKVRIRAFTVYRMCSFIGISYKNYCVYRKRGGAFSDTCETIDTIIREQKFEGAAAGIFNAMIIARDLGLKEKTDVSSEDGSMSPKESQTIIVTSDDVNSILDKI